jgi:hypothetical protein
VTEQHVVVYSTASLSDEPSSHGEDGRLTALVTVQHPNKSHYEYRSQYYDPCIELAAVKRHRRIVPQPIVGPTIDSTPYAVGSHISPDPEAGPYGKLDLAEQYDTDGDVVGET